MALVLTVDSNVLAQAPAFDATAFNGSVSSDVASYWSGQVAGIPATGSTSGAAMTPVLIQGQLGSLSVTDASNGNLGQVRDLVVDTTTGNVVYAVISGGSTAQGSAYVVPMTMLNWQAGQGSSSSGGTSKDLGTFSMNGSQSAFSGAPSIASANQFNPNCGSDLNNANTYWSTQGQSK